MTKVILNQEVNKLGAPGDVVDVKPGFARNFLFPKALATAWSKGAELNIAAIRAARQKLAIDTLEAAKEAGEKISAKQIAVAVKTGPNGRLFGSVTTSDIAEAIKLEAGVVVDKRKVLIANPIKQTGTYTVGVKLHNEVSVDVKISVISAKK